MQLKLSKLLPLAFMPRPSVQPDTVPGPAPVVLSRPMFLPMRFFVPAPQYPGHPDAIPGPAPIVLPRPLFMRLSARSFLSSRLVSAPTRLILTGITKNGAGVAIGSCAVTLYRTADDAVMDHTTSDVVTGVYVFSVLGSGETYYVRATDPTGLLVGTTLNTLVGT